MKYRQAKAVSEVQENLIQVDDEEYLLAAEAARFLGVSRVKFYDDCQPLLHPCKVGVLKRWHYRKSELAAINRVQPVEAVPVVTQGEYVMEFQVGQQVRVIEEASAFHGEVGSVCAIQQMETEHTYEISLSSVAEGVIFEASELEIAGCEMVDQ